MKNRGIPVDEQEAWLHAGWESINDWSAFGRGLMERAARMVHECIFNGQDMDIIVDSDQDGYASAAIFYNYLLSLYPKWVHEHLGYLIHEGKQHGIEDVLGKMRPGVKVLVSPDGGTNDIDCHVALAEDGVDVLVLDHHDVTIDISESPATIINVQSTPYPNKALTGAGVVWQFCRAYDELYAKSPRADDFLDLCALGNVGDMADYHSLEIRAMVRIGFAHIRNKLMFNTVEKNAYTINKRNGVNYLSMAFAVVPFVNAICRSGTMSEKVEVFEAFQDDSDKIFVESSKRGSHGEKVPLYEEAILTMERVKRRQTKAQDEALELLSSRIVDEDRLDDAVLMLLCEPGEVDRNLAGLVANKEQSLYQRPCMVLTRTEDDEGRSIYSGSARNYSMSPIDDFKEVVTSTGKTIFQAGHPNAFGCAIAEDDIEDFISITNEIYKDVPKTPVYHVDYEWNPRSLSPLDVLSLGELDVYGQGIPESQVVVRDIPLGESNVTLMGVAKGNPTLKITVGGVDIIKFRSSQDEYDRMTAGDSYATVVGKCKVNEYNGNVTPQILVDDIEYEQKWIF